MKRLHVLAAGAAIALGAGLLLGPGDVRAGDPEKEKEKKVERRVVVRSGGGGMLGVSLEETEGDVRGAKVRSVEDGSAAEKAGIKDGDVIVRFDGEAVRSASHLARLVRETPAGRSVAVEVSRGGATQKLSATLAEGGRHVQVFGAPGAHGFAFEMPEFDFELPEPPDPPAPPAAPRAPRAPMPHAWSWRGDDGRNLMLHFSGGGPGRLGVEYVEIGEQLAAYFKLPGKSGVLVSSVDADAPAGKAGLKAGDVILKLDGRSIDDGRDLRDAVAAAEGGKPVTVTVQRDGRALDLAVTLAKPEPKVRHRSAGVSL